MYYFGFAVGLPIEHREPLADEDAEPSVGLEPRRAMALVFNGLFLPRLQVSPSVCRAHLGTQGRIQGAELG